MIPVPLFNVVANSTKRGLGIIVIPLIALTLGACDSPDSGAGRTVASLNGPAIQRTSDPVQIANGASLYKQHCAVCHGQSAEGARQWRQRDAEGFYPPPPLNGTGHAWHHSIPLLKQIIMDGSPQGEGRMPAWRGKLTEQEADAVIAWFQSLWPDRVYAAWFEMQQRNGGL